MDNLDNFTRAYIECALWSSTDNSTESGGYPLDDNYTIDDIAPDTLKQMVDDCARFQEGNAFVLTRAYSMRANGQISKYDKKRAGHDFWLTRNGHGTGFWDRGLDEIGEDLTEQSKSYGNYDLEVGDDGKIHGM